MLGGVVPAPPSGGGGDGGLAASAAPPAAETCRSSGGASPSRFLFRDPAPLSASSFFTSAAGGSRRGTTFTRSCWSMTASSRAAMAGRAVVERGVGGSGRVEVRMLVERLFVGKETSPKNQKTTSQKTKKPKAKRRRYYGQAAGDGDPLAYCRFTRDHGRADKLVSRSVTTVSSQSFKGEGKQTSGAALGAPSGERMNAR